MVVGTKMWVDEFEEAFGNGLRFVGILFEKIDQ
jgi:hypothetical protein